MKKRILTGLIALIAVAACSGGSGVNPRATYSELTDSEFVRHCQYLSGNLRSLEGRRCTSGVLQGIELQCPRGNPFRGGACIVSVGDAEACVQTILTKACDISNIAEIPICRGWLACVNGGGT